MLWKSKCKQVRMLLALRAGSDLDDGGQSEIESHLQTCGACRGHWERVQSGQRVLEQIARLSSRNETEASIWPALRIRLLEAGASTEPQPMHAWVPLSAVAVACVAIVMAFQTAGPIDFGNAERAGDPLRDAQPIAEDWRAPPRLEMRPHDRSDNPPLQLQKQRWKISPVSETGEF